MTEKKYQFHQVAEHPQELAFYEQGIAVAEVKGKKICITRHREQWYAFAYNCPHASGLRSVGSVDALGNVVCPVLRFNFSLQTGGKTSGDGAYVRT